LKCFCSRPDARTCLECASRLHLSPLSLYAAFLLFCLVYSRLLILFTITLNKLLQSGATGRESWNVCLSRFAATDVLRSKDRHTMDGCNFHGSRQQMRARLPTVSANPIVMRADGFRLQTRPACIPGSFSC
jgi:hypothetical protein